MMGEGSFWGMWVNVGIIVGALCKRAWGGWWVRENVLGKKEGLVGRGGLFGGRGGEVMVREEDGFRLLNSHTQCPPSDYIVLYFNFLA